MSTQIKRASLVRTGIWVEVFTVLWMLLEASLSIAAGLLAHSVLLVAFGLDSVIELISGAILLWRLLVEARDGNAKHVEQAERRASWVVFVSLALLCLYVLGTSISGLVMGSQPESSPLGIAVAFAAVLSMPVLAWGKRRLAARLDSSALRGDAVNTLTCGYMAATVLIGLVANAFFHWWWAEDVADLGFLIWLVLETREALEEARGNKEEQKEQNGNR